ncbi:MAG: S8/S53 family peptidase [Bacteroidota bacterium]
MQILRITQKLWRGFLVICMGCLLLLPLQAQTDTEVHDYEILVELDPKEEVQDLLRRINGFTRQSAALHLQKTIHRPFNIHLLRFDPEVHQRDELLATMRADRAVIAAQDNDPVTYRSRFPDDPFFLDQWYLGTIDATQAWGITTGGVNARGDTIVVAVLDKGCDITHEDLQGNLWVNKAEIANDGEDNDGNGYVDDFHGLYVKDSTDNHPNRSHGCAVNALIGAKGSNSTGVTGVLWDVKMMLISGATTPAEIVEGYMYAYEQRKAYNESNGERGAYVVVSNFSAGIDRRFCDEYPVWGGMFDKLGSVGILNIGATTNSDVNVDIVGDMPTTCPSDFLLTVTSTNRSDDKAERAGFGERSIDLGAPGEGMFSAKPNNDYGDIMDGTSWATPLVAGAVALLYTTDCNALTELSFIDPPAAALAMKQLIVDGAESIPTLEGRSVSGGRLSLFESMKVLDERFANPKGELSIFEIVPNLVREQVIVRYKVPEAIEYDIRIFDAVGRLIGTEEVPRICAAGQTTMDVSDLPNGMYFVSIGREKAIDTKRFVKY